MKDGTKTWGEGKKEGGRLYTGIDNSATLCIYPAYDAAAQECTVTTVKIDALPANNKGIVKLGRGRPLLVNS